MKHVCNSFIYMQLNDANAALPVRLQRE